MAAVTLVQYNLYHKQFVRQGCTVTCMNYDPSPMGPFSGMVIGTGLVSTNSVIVPQAMNFPCYFWWADLLCYHNSSLDPRWFGGGQPTSNRG